MQTLALAVAGSIPVAWSMLAASDNLFILAIHLAILLVSFSAGYFLNRYICAATTVMLIGLPMAVLTPPLALSSDGIYSIVLVTIFEAGVGLVAVGLGAVAHSLIGPWRSRVPSP